MKKIKMFLPMLIVLAAAFTAFAFKPAKNAAVTEHRWYVLVGENPNLASSYELDEDYNPDFEGCEGNGDICAIKSLGDEEQPYITGDPNTDTNVEMVAKRE